jgi:hypothetical protein
VPGFRPSCVVNLKLKFDEALTLRKSGTLKTQKDELAAPNEPTFTTWRTPLGTIPLILQVGEANVSFLMALVPKTLSYEKPGYRQAATWSAEFDFRQLPIDPRTVRSAALEIHTGVVSDEDFAAGYIGKRGISGSLRSILQTRIDGKPNATTLRLLGVVDNWEVEHSGSGSRVTMQGRDMRGILLDTPIGPDGASDKQLLELVDWSKDIQQVVSQIIAYNSFFSDLMVRVNVAEWPGKKLPSPGYEGIITRTEKGARGKKRGGAPKPAASGSSLNFWDLIVNACYLCGAIPYMRGTYLAIRPAQTMFDRLRGPIDGEQMMTPFAEGKPRSVDAMSGSSLTPELKVRRIVYGRDTDSLRLNRKYAGWRKPKIVRAVSVDINGKPEAKQVMGMWPREEDLKARKVADAPGADSPKEEVVNVPCRGITDKQRLEEIAHAVYEEIGRGELGGECSTPNLASFGGDNSDPDLLSLEPGDGVEFMVDTHAIKTGGAPLISTFTDSMRRSFNDQVREILKHLGTRDENLARVIVATARGQVGELQNFFRVQTVKFNWDAASGVKLAFDFQNYVVARAQVGEAPSAEPGKPQDVSVGKGGNKKGPRSLGNI